MIQTAKDTSKIVVALAIAFFVATLLAAYMLYALPGNLMLTNGHEPALVKTYLTVAIAFIIGMITLYMAIQSKQQIIVYKEKQESKTADTSADGDLQKTTISLESVKNTLDVNKPIKELSHDFLFAICKQLEAGQGAYYTATEREGKRRVELTDGYALSVTETSSIGFDFGEGLIGQAANEGRTLYVDDIPEGYIKIVSGLGSASPRYLLIVPVKDNSTVTGVVELASFKPFEEDQRRFVEEASELLTKQSAS